MLTTRLLPLALAALFAWNFGILAGGVGAIGMFSVLAEELPRDYLIAPSTFGIGGAIGAFIGYKLLRFFARIGAIFASLCLLGLLTLSYFSFPSFFELLNQ